MYCDYSKLNEIDDLFVLLVDKDKSNLLRFEKKFLEYGVHVAKAESIEEARHLVNEFSYDMIFVDVSLTDNSPCELAIESHLAHQNVPYVVAWSDLNQECAGILKQLGFDDYIFKPASFDLFHCLICQIYEKWQMTLTEAA